MGALATTVLLSSLLGIKCLNIVTLQLTCWIRNMTIWLFCLIQHLNGFCGVISMWKPRQQKLRWPLMNSSSTSEWRNFICSHLSVFTNVTQLRNTKYSKAELAVTEHLMPTSWTKTRSLQTKQLLFTHTNMTFSLCGAEKEAAETSIDWPFFCFMSGLFEFRTSRFFVWFKIYKLLPLLWHSIN